MNRPNITTDLSFEPYRDYLRFLAQAEFDRRLQARLDPSDVVQQTLLEAYEASLAKRDRVVGQSDAERAAWLRQILANNLANALRDNQRAKRDIGRERSLERALEASSSRLEVFLDSGQSSPSKKLSREELVLRLAQAVAGLPEAQRQAVVLQRFENLSLAATAERMNRSRDSIIGLLRRGVKRLREELKDEVT